MQSAIASHFVDIQGGMLMSLIAFSIVFLVIAGLMLMMMALKLFSVWMQGTSAGTSARTAPSAPAPANQPSKAQDAPRDDDELAAVITAAIASSLGRTVRIASFAPTAARPRTSAWRVTGRLNSLEGFAD
ncbi:MAG: OadG family protein [Synergistaceae bacterium]|jgi:Na+-transporting methylmalonyl-CoA/oxaloacetate decarboxylase gamma subunit|nr:OadG family protein [Synergistaceae bacterium]